MGGRPTEDHNRIAEFDRGPCSEDTVFVYYADETWQVDPGPSGLDFARQSDRQRTAAERAKAQQEVAAAVAAELSLLLRDKPYSQSVLHYATGHYADIRDVLLAHEGRQERREAWQAWLEGYRDGPDFQTVWAVAKTITDARDAHRQAVREAALLRKAQQDVARAGAFFGKVSAGPDEDWPGLPRPNPTVWLTTLKTCHEGGRADEYVYLCPMTRGKSDPAGLAKLARRYAKQCEWEQTEGGRTLYRLVLSDEGWKRQAAAWRQRKRRTGQDVAWQAYHTEEGVTVLHDSQTVGGAAIPTDTAGLYALTHALLADVPEGKKTRTSAGFGGEYQGSRGDGRVRHAKRQGKAGQWELVGQYVTEGPGIRQAAALLGMELTSKLRGRVQLDHEDGLLTLLENGFTLKPRKAHTAALSVFDVLLASPDEGNVTLNVHSEDLPTCTVSVTEDTIDEAWPALPAQPSLLEALPQPAAIYFGGETWSR